jgi:Methyltransferase domain
VKTARLLEPNGRLIAVDLQPEMVALATERVRNAGLDNVEFHVADAHRLPLEDASADRAFLVGVLPEIAPRKGRSPSYAGCSARRASSPSPRGSSIQTTGLPSRPLARFGRRGSGCYSVSGTCGNTRSTSKKIRERKCILGRRFYAFRAPGFREERLLPL